MFGHLRAKFWLKDTSIGWGVKMKSENNPCWSSDGKRERTKQRSKIEGREVGDGRYRPQGGDCGEPSMKQAATGTKRDVSAVWCTSLTLAEGFTLLLKPCTRSKTKHFFNTQQWPSASKKVYVGRWHVSLIWAPQPDSSALQLFFTWPLEVQFCFLTPVLESTRCRHPYCFCLLLSPMKMLWHSSQSRQCLHLQSLQQNALHSSHCADTTLENNCAVWYRYFFYWQPPRSTKCQLLK